ncbi:DUF4271 domain-containing protein [Mariniflexile sp.]|uniref:DUF4271 domain-containing protein n=1 Tax=Mariniflexile sp. TaxID=1979402 RepID=UPI004048D8CF
MLVVSLVVIALAKLTSPKRFNDFVTVLGNSKYLKIYAREQKFLDRFDALLFTNLIISLSLFSYIVYGFFTETRVISVDTMFKLSFGICVYILIKVFVERLIGSLMEIDEMIDQYLFQKISYKNYLGLVLIPVNAFLLFSFKPTLTFFYVIVILLFIVIITGLITSIKAYQSLIKHNFFYFILYLCALEIAPGIILYKVFISK